MEFRSTGRNVRIYTLAKILHPEVISIGNNVIIDDFVFLNGGKNTCIGSYVHIASFCSIIGGGEFVMEDFSGLSAGCRIVTGTDDFSGSSLTNPTVPLEFRNVERSFVRIEKHAIVGSNTVVLPGVTVGEGVAVGACSLVTRDLEPWTVNVGVPAKPIGKRPKEIILDMERKLREKYGES
jgi:galactoside O-acetyltransferase